MPLPGQRMANKSEYIRILAIFGICWDYHSHLVEDSWPSQYKFVSQALAAKNANGPAGIRTRVRGSGGLYSIQTILRVHCESIRSHMHTLNETIEYIGSGLHPMGDGPLSYSTFQNYLYVHILWDLNSHELPKRALICIQIYEPLVNPHLPVIPGS